MSDPGPETPANRTLIWTIAGFGFAVAVLAELASFQLGGGAGAPAVLPLAQTLDAQAAQAFASDRSKSRALTVRTLAVRPVNARAWLRLAELDGDRPASFGAGARLSLSRSYETGPYDAHLVRERVRFAYDHWPKLGPDLQEQVSSEVDVAWRAEAPRGELMGAAAGVSDPLGRLALATRMFTLKLQDDVAARAKNASAANGALRGVQ
jgi:hypothetical protein